MKNITQGAIADLLSGIAEILPAAFKFHPLKSHVEKYKQAPAFVGWGHVQRGEPWGTALRIVIDLPISIDEETSRAVGLFLQSKEIPFALDYPAVPATPLKYECGCLASNGEYNGGWEVHKDFKLSCPEHGKPVVCDASFTVEVSRHTTSGIY